MRDAYFRTVRIVVIAILLGSLPFWILPTGLGIRRGLLNLDYLGLVWLASTGVSSWVVLVAFVVAHLADLLRSFAPVFNFGLIDGLLALPILSARVGSGTLLVVGVLVAWLAAASALFVKVTMQPLARLSRPLVVVAALTAVVLDLLFRPPVEGRPRFAEINVAYSGIASVAGALRRDLLEGRFQDRSPPPVAERAAAGMAEALGAGVLPNRVLLVMVESWGVLRDSTAAAILAAVFRTPALHERYAIRSGSIQFSGATTAGEIRELCGVKATHRLMLRWTPDGCLPAQLQRRGYHSTAVHGNQPYVFDRDHWYPQIGFDEMLWISDLEPSFCGSVVRGTCDNAALEAIAERLRRPLAGRQFLYWLTLSTHWPFDPEYGRGMGWCTRLLPGRDGTEECVLVDGLARTLEGVAAMLADPGVEPPFTVIVGDHGPPRFRSSVAQRFVSDRVPFVELRPLSPSTGWGKVRP